MRPNAGDFEWEWTADPIDPDLVTDEVTVVVSPDVTTTYTVVGTPISECLTNTVSKVIVVEFSEGPQIEWEDPGPQCEEFDLSTLVFTDLNGTIDPNIVFLSEFPSNSGQTEPAIGPIIGPDDEVWLMIGDTAAGCYDAEQIILEWGGLNAAGDDGSTSLCGESGVMLDMYTLLSEDANLAGTFNEETGSGQFNAGTGMLDVSGLNGIYTFTYTVTGLAPCPDDQATFTVEVFPQPTANFEYNAGGLSSDDDGMTSTCIVNTVNMENFSTIPGGGPIDNYNWNFGDGTGSTAINPSHTYTSTGTFTITLTVSTDDGCTSTFTKDILIYSEPVLDIIFNNPLCFGFSDGSVTAFVAGGSGTFEIEILNADGDQENPPGSNTANALPAGVYTINVTDASGCSATQTVTLVNPPELEVVSSQVVDPLCFGGTGYIVIDSVVGEDINNPIQYYWTPNPYVPPMEGFGVDSIDMLEPGTYTLTILDNNGCSNITTFTIEEPEKLRWVEGEPSAEGALGEEGLGYIPALCRTAGFQNGGGVVFASAVPGPTSVVWTETATGNTSTDGTWGGRNPGEYTVTATQTETGCTLTGTIIVDSLNPIASFTVESDQLNADCKGTAEVEAQFTNTSQNYFSPALSDPQYRFYWDLSREDVNDWDITDDYNYRPDTTYLAEGSTYEVEVCLVAQNRNDCRDTACKIITVFEPIKLVNVNIFTPNGDGINDIFTFSQYQASIAQFQCVIVNRWGVQVGEISDINDGWDGTDNNDTPCQDGVYFYTYEATSDDGTKLVGQGTVQIQGSEVE